MPAGWGLEGNYIDDAEKKRQDQLNADNAIALQRAGERVDYSTPTPGPAQQLQPPSFSQPQQPSFAVPPLQSPQVGLTSPGVDTGVPGLQQTQTFNPTVEAPHIDRHTDFALSGAQGLNSLFPQQNQQTPMPLAGSQPIADVLRSSVLPLPQVPPTGIPYVDQMTQSLGMLQQPKQNQDQNPDKPPWMQWIENNIVKPVQNDVMSYVTPQGVAQHQVNMQAAQYNLQDWFNNNPNTLYANEQANRSLANVNDPNSPQSKQAAGWVNIGKTLAQTGVMGVTQVGQIIQWANSQPVRQAGVGAMNLMNKDLNYGLIPATTPINQWLVNKNAAGGLDWFPASQQGSSIYNKPPSPSIASSWASIGAGLNQGLNSLNPNFEGAKLLHDPLAAQQEMQQRFNSLKTSAPDDPVSMINAGLKQFGLPPLASFPTPDVNTWWGKIINGAQWIATDTLYQSQQTQEVMNKITDAAKIDPQLGMMKRDVWSGPSKMLNATVTAQNRQSNINDLASQYQMAMGRGDADGAAYLYDKMLNIKDKSYSDILNENMNPWAELLGAIYGDVSPLGWGGHILGHGVGEFTKAFNLNQYSKIYDIGKEAASSNLDLALMRGADFMKDVAGVTEPGNMFKGSGIVSAWEKSVAPYMSTAERVTQSPLAAGGLFGLDAKGKALVDADVLIKNLKMIFSDTVSQKSDARAVLNALVNDPKSLVEGIKGFVSPEILTFGSKENKVLNPQGFMKWGPGVIGNTELTRRFPILTMAKDMLQNMSSLAGDGAIEGEKFWAEMAGVIFDTSRQVNGAALPNKLPFGAAAVKVIEGAEGLGRYAYQNAKGKNLFLSEVMPLEKAQQYVDGITSSGAFEGGVKNLTAIPKLLLDVQKRLMSDMYLFYRPANWLRNAVSGSAMLTANDMYGSARRADMIDWFVKKAGMKDPLTGVSDLTARSLSGGLIGPILNRVLGDTNWMGKTIANLVEKAPNIAYGDSYLPGTNVALGEEAMRMQGFFRRAKDNVTTVWTRNMNETYQKLTQYGIDNNVAKLFTDGLRWHGINGSAEDVAKYANDFLQTGKFKLTPESFNLPTDVLSSKGYTELSRVISTYGPEQWQQAQHDLQVLFGNEMKQPLEWLRSSPKQSGDMSWMKKSIPDQAQMIADLTRRYMIRAGENIGDATTKSAQTADQFLASHADAWNSFRDALRSAPNTPNSWAVASDYYNEYNKVMRTANSQVDQLTRDAAQLQDWGNHALNVRGIYDQVSKDTSALGRKYTAALEQVRQGKTYTPVTKGWIQALEDNMNFDQSWFNGLKDYAVKSVEDPKYTQKVQAWRGYIETKTAGMMEAFRMFPSMDNFNIVTQTMGDLTDIGKAAALKMSEAKDLLNTGRLTSPSYRDISDSIWEQASGYMAAHAEATGRAITAHAIMTNTSDTLKFKVGANEYYLYGPKSADTWEAINAKTGQLKEFGEQAAGQMAALPQGIIDEWYRLTNGRAAAAPAVAEANIAKGAEALPKSAAAAAMAPPPRVIVPPPTTSASVQAAVDEGKQVISQGDQAVAALQPNPRPSAYQVANPTTDYVHVRTGNKWKMVPIDDPEVDSAAEVRLVPGNARKAPVVPKAPLETTAGMTHQEVKDTYGPILQKYYGYSEAQIQSLSEPELRWAVEDMAAKKPLSPRLAGMDMGQTLPSGPQQIPGGYGSTSYEGSPSGPTSQPYQTWSPEGMPQSPSGPLPSRVSGSRNDILGATGDISTPSQYRVRPQPTYPEAQPLGTEFDYGYGRTTPDQWQAPPTEGLSSGMPPRPGVDINETDAYGPQYDVYNRGQKPGSMPEIVPPEGSPPAPPAAEQTAPEIVKKRLRQRKPIVAAPAIAPEAAALPTEGAVTLSDNRRQIYHDIIQNRYGLGDAAISKFSDAELESMYQTIKQEGNTRPAVAATAGREGNVPRPIPAAGETTPPPTSELLPSGDQKAATQQTIDQTTARSQERVQNPAPSDVWKPPALKRQKFWGENPETVIYSTTDSAGEQQGWLRTTVKGGDKLIPEGTDHLYGTGGMWSRAPGGDAYYVVPIDAKAPEIDLTPAGIRKRSQDVIDDVHALQNGTPHDATGLSHDSPDYEWWRSAGNQPVDDKLAYPLTGEVGQPVKVKGDTNLAEAFAPLGVRKEPQAAQGTFDNMTRRFQLPRPEDRRILQKSVSPDRIEFSFRSPVQGQEDLRLLAQKKGEVYVVTYADGKAAAPAPFKTLQDAAAEARSLMENGSGVGAEGLVVKGRPRSFPAGFDSAKSAQRVAAREYLKGMTPAQMLDETFADPSNPKNQLVVRNLLNMSGIQPEKIQSWVANGDRRSMLDAIEHALGMRGMPGSGINEEPFFFGSVLPVSPEIMAMFHDGYQKGVTRLAEDMMGGISFSQKAAPVRGFNTTDLALHNLNSIKEMESTLTDPVTLQRMLGGMDSGLDNNARRGIMGLLGDVKGLHDNTVATSFASAENDVNWAMLDFRKSRKVDHWLGAYGPFSFFQTRMPGRAILAGLQRPDIVGRYYKLQQAIQNENNQSQVPDFQRGTLPIPGTNMRMGANQLLLDNTPALMWLANNTYFTPRDTDNPGDAVIQALDSAGPNMGPVQHVVADSLLHGSMVDKTQNNVFGSPREPLTVSSLIPWYRMGYLATQARTGQLAVQPAAGSWFNGTPTLPGDLPAVGRNIDSNFNVGTDVEGYARAAAQYQGYGQTPPPGAISNQAQQLATSAIKQTGWEKFWQAISAYSFAPVTVYTDNMAKSQQLHDERSSLYFNQGQNPAGSRAAVRSFDQKTQNEGRDFMAYVGQYTQSPQDALRQAQATDLGYRQAAISNKYVALQDQWIKDHPLATTTEYNNFVFGTIIPNKKAEMDKAKADLPLGAANNDAGAFGETDRYAAENPQELQAASNDEAIRQAEGDLAAKGINPPSALPQGASFESQRINKQQKDAYEKQVDAVALTYLNNPQWVQTTLGGRDPQTGKIIASDGSAPGSSYSPAGTSVPNMGSRSGLGVSNGQANSIGTGSAKTAASTYPAGLPSPRFGPQFPTNGVTGGQVFTPDPNNPYAAKMAEQEKLYGLPPGILQAVAKRESGYSPTASSGAASGLMQFTPGTWATVAKKLNLTDITDPDQSIEAAAYYLDEINKGLPPDKQGDPGWMAAAYNTGPAAVANMSSLQDILTTKNPYTGQPYQDARQRLAYAAGIQQEVGGVQQLATPDAAGGSPSQATSLAYPVASGTTVSETFGADVAGYKQWNGNSGHEGVDFAVPVGTPVSSAANGTVEFAGTGNGFVNYGNYIVIDHGNGVRTYYGHLSGFDVKAGDTVAQGQQIGESGNSGRTTGPHLHFGVRIEGDTSGPYGMVDPMPYLNGQKTLPGQQTVQMASTQQAAPQGYGGLPVGQQSNLPIDVAAPNQSLTGGQQATSTTYDPNNPGANISLPPVGQVASGTNTPQGASDLQAYRQSVQDSYQTPTQQAQQARFDQESQAGLDYVTKTYPQYANELKEYDALILQDQRTAYSDQHPEVKALHIALYNPDKAQQVESMFGAGALLRYARIPASTFNGGQPGERDAYYRQDPTSFLTKAWIEGRPQVSVESNNTITPQDFGSDYQQAQKLFGNDIWTTVQDYYRLPGGTDRAAKTARAQWYDANPTYTAWSDWWYGLLPQSAQAGYQSFGGHVYNGHHTGGYPPSISSGGASLQAIRANAVTLARARRGGVDAGGWKKWLTKQ